MVQNKISKTYNKNISANNILLSIREDRTGLTKKEFQTLSKNDKVFVYFK